MLALAGICTSISDGQLAAKLDGRDDMPPSPRMAARWGLLEKAPDPIVVTDDGTFTALKVYSPVSWLRRPLRAPPEMPVTS